MERRLTVKEIRIKRARLKKKIEKKKAIRKVVFGLTVASAIGFIGYQFYEGVKWTKENPEAWQQEIKSY